MPANRGTKGLRAVVVLPLLGLLGACGASSSSWSEATSVSPTVVTPSSSAPPATEPAIQQALVPGAWNGARTSGDGSTLVVFFVGAAEYDLNDPREVTS